MKSGRAFVGRWEVDSLSKGLLRARWKDQVSSWVIRAVARNWREGGSMVQEIAEMRHKGRG